MKTKRTTYKVLVARDAERLANLVNEFLERGYELQGGVCIDSEDGTCFQAVTITTTENGNVDGEG